MRALVRLVGVHGEPNRIRLTPQVETAEEREWLLLATRDRGFFDFEISDNTIKLFLIEAAELNARL